MTNANSYDMITERWKRAKERNGQAEGSERKSQKNSKKALDKREWLWYNHKALLREGNEPWKLNNDKNETLED